MSPQHHTAKDLQACIDECVACHAICVETMTYCLEQGGQHAKAAHIRLLLDCAQVCQTSAEFMLRGSELHAETCAVCADVCERCADSCKSMGDDEKMARCAEACSRCADSCQRMAGGSKIAHTPRSGRE